MKWLLLLGVCLVAAAAEDVVEKTLKVDIQPLLQDESKWKPYRDCLLDKAPCGDLQFVKDAVTLGHPDCQTCTDDQKHTYMKNWQLFKEKYPQDMDEIDKKYSKATTTT